MRITQKSVIIRNTALEPVDIGGQFGMLNVETGKYIVLNEVGARIWDFAAEPVSVGDVVTRLIKEFDVSSGDCKDQVISYVERLKKEKLIRIKGL